MNLRPQPRTIAALQSAYLVGTGVWPLLHRGSFELVTGRKREFWLVRTVGGLAAATGVSLGIATTRSRKRHETVALALGTGIVFGLADLRAARSHSRIYLADAALQAIFATAWLRPWVVGRIPPPPRPARGDQTVREGRSANASAAFLSSTPSTRSR
jgi:hypothetical protein